MIIEELVYDIIHAWKMSSVIQERVARSPEPYRAMIYETGILSREVIEAIEETDEYDNLVNELERQWGSCG